MHNSTHRIPIADRAEISPCHCCVLMPAYNETGHIGHLIRQALQYCGNVALIDDGSTDGTDREAEAAGAVVLRSERNMGKGAALNLGFQYARDKNFHAVITMDSDGQHRPEDIPKFIEAYKRTGIPVLIGNRMATPESMPRIRKWTNRYMSWLLSRVMNWYVPDTQCGFRFYRADLVPFLSTEEERFAAESEVLLQIAHRAIRIGSVRIQTVYSGSKSHIKPIGDTIRFYRMLRRYKKKRRKQYA